MLVRTRTLAVAVAVLLAPALAEAAPAADGTTCTAAADCQSGHCVDGVCCDTACTGTCQSCALPAAPGKCTLQPSGTDLRHDCGAAGTCTGTCDGAGACTKATEGTTCAAARCEGSDVIGRAYCTASGACDTATAQKVSCAPYACDAVTARCHNSCATNADCVNGNVCDAATKACKLPGDPVGDLQAKNGDGCALGGGAGGGLLPAVALALAGLGLARRRVRPR